MSDPKIVASARNQKRSGPMHSDSSQSWLILGWIGLVFLVVGGMDFALVWLPMNFGNPEWEFATVTQSFNGLPILLLGVGLLAVAAEVGDRRWWSLIVIGVAAVMLIWILAGAGLWASRVGLALSTVPNELRFGVQEAIAKTAVQSLVYSAALMYLGVRTWRSSGTGATDE